MLVIRLIFGIVLVVCLGEALPREAIQRTVTEPKIRYTTVPYIKPQHHHEHHEQNKHNKHHRPEHHDYSKHLEDDEFDEHHDFDHHHHHEGHKEHHGNHEFQFEDHYHHEDPHHEHFKVHHHHEEPYHKHHVHHHHGEEEVDKVFVDGNFGQKLVVNKPQHGHSYIHRKKRGTTFQQLRTAPETPSQEQILSHHPPPIYSEEFQLPQPGVSRTTRQTGTHFQQERL